MRIPLLLLLGTFALGGCASHNRPGEPIVDLTGVDPVLYDQDLGECRVFAKQVPVATQTGAGAAAGAVLGTVIGAAIGDSGTAARGAGVGAANGAARGAFGGFRERSQVVKNCLRQRGYRVLN
ncbi:MAG: glycine zipper family protein [Pseudomonadota bacterium]